ncbi:PREDICTED: insulin-like growth factor-binding protein 3 [Haliaeetus leucocephalus]|uniref:insulin-like growth factor-binding protein 3 n=1 Tax=Haliaeetus leucocephalus TaxID=52644 RepID=UPI00053CB935|nr:PREDICTED: insulin-like growth factor-binding protein 3 [Haliaeetus leucocephalus]
MVVAGSRVEVAGFRVSGSLRGRGGGVPREAAGSKGMLQLRKGIARQQRHGCMRNAELFVLSYIAGNSSDSEEEDRSTSSMENQAIPNSHRVPDSKLHPPHIKIDIIRKVQAKNTQRYKVEYDSQSTDTLNFSSESKQETEYGPCRREMEDTLNHLKILNVLSPRGFHIPNCDKKGFYKKKQCRPSKGRKRGYCWCVDKYGQPLPGYDGKGKGDVHCYNLESK